MSGCPKAVAAMEKCFSIITGKHQSGLLKCNVAKISMNKDSTICLMYFNISTFQ